MLSIRNSLQIYDIGKLKVKGWKKIHHGNIRQSKVGVTALI